MLLVEIISYLLKKKKQMFSSNFSVSRRLWFIVQNSIYIICDENNIYNMRWIYCSNFFFFFRRILESKLNVTVNVTINVQCYIVTMYNTIQVKL